MTQKELERWRRAGNLARLAMGRRLRVRGDPERYDLWEADCDPLAWWCLTEAIYGISK